MEKTKQELTSVTKCQVENLANRYGQDYKDCLELLKNLKRGC